MNQSPLRKLFAFRPSMLAGGIALGVILIAANILFAAKTDYGSSFYSYWLSGRVLFAQGDNPYDDALVEQVQNKYRDDPNVSGFSLPLYAVLPVLPFAFIDYFKTALVLWRLLLEGALIIAGIRLIPAFRITNPLTPAAVCVILPMCCYYGIIALIDGEISILAVAFLLIAVSALQDGEFELAGIMLAFSTIKCSLTLLPVLWILIWCLNNERGAIVAWFGAVLALLFLIAMLFQTNWYVPYLRSMLYYLKHLNPNNISRILEAWQPELGGRIGWAVSGVMLLIMLIEWFVNAKGNRDAMEWVLALTLTVGFLVGIPNLGKHLYILWIPAVYAMDKMVLRWERRGQIYCLVLWLISFALPWITHLTIFSFLNPIENLNIVLPFILFLLLYWNRWWIIDTYVDAY